jgi:hypothetical protein
LPDQSARDGDVRGERALGIKMPLSLSYHLISTLENHRHRQRRFAE